MASINQLGKEREEFAYFPRPVWEREWEEKEGGLVLQPKVLTWMGMGVRGGGGVCLKEQEKLFSESFEWSEDEGRGKVGSYK